VRKLAITETINCTR